MLRSITGNPALNQQSENVTPGSLRCSNPVVCRNYWLLLVARRWFGLYVELFWSGLFNQCRDY